MSEPSDRHPLELLTAYADDELSIEDRAVVDRHLAQCASCRGHLEATRLLAGAMADEPVPPPPDDIAVRIARRIDEPVILPFRRSRFRIPATIAATIAAIGLVGVVAWRQGALRPGAPAATPQLDERKAPAEETERLKDTKASESEVQGAREREFGKPPAANKQASASASGNERGHLDQPLAPPPPRERDQGVPAGVAGGVVGGVEAGAPERAERQDADTAANDALAKSKKEYEEPRAAAAPPPAARAAQAQAAQPAPAPEAPAMALPEPTIQADKTLAAIAPSSVCRERWVDAGVIATWEVVDRSRAASEIAALAAKHGGFVQPDDPSTPGLIGVVVPAKRFAAFAVDARSRGIDGVGSAPGDVNGPCIRQRIGLLPAAPR